MSDSATTSTRTRTITWEDPLVTAQAGSAMSGIDMLRAVQAGALPPPPIALLMGFWLDEVAEGRAVFAVQPAEYHYNPIGVVHGGLAMTLLDSALGCAIQSLLPTGVVYTTLETKVNLVRALTRETGLVRCVATVIHLGNRTATAEGRITDAAGTLYAHGTTTCLIIRP
jgi:uncharacterized protein (TIGR00369 family)